MSVIEEKFKCFAEVLGDQLGDLVRCMVEAEIANHTSRIQQLTNILNGNICDSSVTESSDTGSTTPTV